MADYRAARAKHTPTCKTCGQLGVRLDFVDTYACRGCNTWLEQLCGDQNCLYCAQRARFKTPDSIPPDEWNNPQNTGGAI